MARLPITIIHGHGLSEGLFEGLEDLTQTFKAGAPLINNAGYLDEAGANPAAGTIVGISTRDAHNNAAAGVESDGRPALLGFVPPLPEATFAANFDKASGLGVALAITDLYKIYGITKDANGIWYVDQDKPTGGGTARVVVIGAIDAIGTASARVMIKFLPESTIYGQVIA